MAVQDCNCTNPKPSLTSSGLAQLYIRLLGQLVSRCCRSEPAADSPGNSAVTYRRGRNSTQDNPA